MDPVTEFSREDALALQAFLASPSRPKATMGYFESAGFLFAVCCNPDMVQPSEWMPEILGENYGDVADLEEAQRMLQLMMRFYNHINHGVLERRPDLPWGCDVLPEPLANLDEDAPLSRWARGFGEGTDWLQESWPEELPSELDSGLGACLLVLTFFSSRRLAEAYWKESQRAGYTLEAMAKKMSEMIRPTMAAYADLGRSLYEGTLVKPPSGKRGSRSKNKSKSRKKGKRT
jgi:yecA family protein